MEELNWKEEYVYRFLKEHKDVRYNGVTELYKAMGMSRKAAHKIICKLEADGYIYWQPRNPDGRYYILLLR